MNHKITLLIPIQNAEKTLDRCFESIQNQTYQNFEIVCIDNGSQDESLRITKKWQEFFGVNRFVIIQNETNLGVTKALNQGLDKITTEFTARIDGDDWWEPTKLEKQIKFLENNPKYGVVGTNYINFKRNLEIKITAPKADDEIRKTIIKRNPFAHSCVVFRTELIKSVGNYNSDVYMGQDYDLWLKCMPYCKFYNIQEFLCHRSIESGISFERQREQMIQCLKTQKKYIEKYNLPIFNYLYLLEPILVILTPNFIKMLKRKFQ
jgi:glycosyltransferase involved in cell wall biosynthesis